MAGNARDIKSRIESLAKTASITKALEHISITKTKRLQNSFRSYNKYLLEFNRILENAACNLKEHPLLTGNNEGLTLYILITSDRGLVGNYHNLLFQKTLKLIEETKENYQLLVIGRKGFSFARKHKLNVVNKENIVNRDYITTLYFKKYSRDIYEYYLNGQIKEVKIIYMHFLNQGIYEPRIEQVLPMELNLDEHPNINGGYIYDQDPKIVLENLGSMYVDTKIYGCLIDGQLSEHSARYIAMMNATENAEKGTEELELLYNRARQEAITSELIDIINGNLQGGK